MYKTLQIHKMTSTAPIYVSKFSYTGKHSFAQFNPMAKGEKHKVDHGDDLIYLFKIPLLFPDPLDLYDKAVSVRMVNSIVNFVRDLAPTNSLECVSLDPMCEYVEFYNRDASGQYGTRNEKEFDMEMIQIFDELNEIPA